MTYIFHSDSKTETAKVSNDLATRWGSQCHMQPVMENTAVLITEQYSHDIEEFEGTYIDWAEGTCRRCGKWGRIYYQGNINRDNIYFWTSSLDK